ncbi:hypothetical protein TWF569_005059 [Orbilia oligospora]|uniref:Mitochondrial resolvase Ydc2 catalytic domain-containing protein n=1 Tax=Orbilia oligospora TaxID=2813651 RepID=A0A7C8P0J5_ORBOL|nr:hypothetical protein TWF103_003299 [Orbilia oligospora]KAF3084767.1 hypothetical protein TWF706_000675 [Orbilia oligospora]KAF3093637.1 hypothetical protein TWF102_007857 [Orbilia oligospora]KAF3123807.1 hypothetical protein TWF703_000649 [Orbilia oligospora]KAF3125346.1 hypothetical protein TWF594_001605 [Orbilia oligospora]
MLQRLSLLRNGELKDILQRCGWPVSGTKAVMAMEIQARSHRSRLATYQRSRPGMLEPAEKQLDEHRILSIDMGIKNMALCLLRVSRQEIFSSEPVTPEILTWQKFSLYDHHLNHGHENNLNSGTQDMDFASVSLAPLATALARQLITTHKPTIIAIEKQRYRTTGSAAVQEWTLRVNKLEAMLHATLRVLQEEGIWEQGATHSICPQKTTRYWLGQYGLTDGARKGTVTKPLKVKLVKSWLENGHNVVYKKSNFFAADTASLFSKVSSQAKTRTGEKLDDLADCLLQGLALIHWEISRLKLLEGWE